MPSVDDLPPIGTYWTEGGLEVKFTTSKPSSYTSEAYATCARCGSFTNDKDRHDYWHKLLEAQVDESTRRTSLLQAAIGLMVASVEPGLAWLDTKWNEKGETDGSNK